MVDKEQSPKCCDDGISAWDIPGMVSFYGGILYMFYYISCPENLTAPPYY
jgi:hypothetical protein